MSRRQGDVTRHTPPPPAPKPANQSLVAMYRRERKAAFSRKLFCVTNIKKCAGHERGGESVFFHFSQMRRFFLSFFFRIRPWKSHGVFSAASITETERPVLMKNVSGNFYKVIVLYTRSEDVALLPCYRGKHPGEEKLEPNRMQQWQKVNSSATK